MTAHPVNHPADHPQVHSFPAKHFQVAISRTGVMFFADPGAAFANIGSALEPGGRLAFLTHSHVGKRFQAVFDALTEHVPPPAGPTGPGAAVASLADPAYVRRVLQANVDGGVVRLSAHGWVYAATIHQNQ